MSDWSAFSAAAPLLLIGGGKMGGALLDGWLRDGLSANAVVVADPSEGIRTAYDARGIITVDGPDAISAAPRLAMFATKPQVMDAVVAAYARKLPATCLALSIAAGLPISFFAARLVAQTPIVRAMPNTPAAVGAGVTALFADVGVSDTDKALCAQLLSAVGQVVWLDEEQQMDAVTGVSGSGPAYVFHLIECLTAAAIAQGLPEPLAVTLATHTVFGAGKLAADESSPSAEQLRINVTSPNGTTAAGLDQLMAQLPDLVNRTVAAAADRSRELSQA